MIIPNGIDKNSIKWREYVLGIQLCEYTLSFLYTNNLQKQKLNLKETYSKLEINEQNIYASLFSIIYNCKYNNLMKDDQILDMLNTEFSKINIRFIKTNTNTPFSSHPNEGIIQSETEKNQMYITVSPKFFNLIQTASINNDILNDLAKAIFSEYTHEYTHLYQINNEKIPQSNIEIKDMQTLDDNRTYLKHPREVDANARQFANELLMSGKSIHDIFNLITSKVNSSHLYLMKYLPYKKYYNVFGITNDLNSEQKDLYEKEKPGIIQENKKIFQQFLKRTYDFLLLDESFALSKYNALLNPFIE